MKKLFNNFKVEIVLYNIIKIKLLQIIWNCKEKMMFIYLEVSEEVLMLKKVDLD